jgi:hypothetical protein
MGFPIESDAGHAGGVEIGEEQLVVAHPIVLEGQARPVRLIDVEFNAELGVLPPGVDLEAADEAVHRRLRQPGLPHDLEKPPLEPRAGEDRGLPIDREDVFELRRPRMVGVPPEHLAHWAEVEQVKIGGPLQHPRDGPPTIRSRKVQVRPRQRGDRNPFPDRAFVTDEHRGVDGVRPPRAPRLRRRHFDLLRPVPGDVPEPRRRPIAGDDRLLSARHPSRRRRHAPPLPGQILMPHRIDPPVHPMDFPSRLAVVNPGASISQPSHLPGRHHPMLRRR